MPDSAASHDVHPDNGRLAVRLAFWLALGTSGLGVGFLIGYLATGLDGFAVLGFITLSCLLPAVVLVATILLVIGLRRGVHPARVAVAATLLVFNIPLAIACLAIGENEYSRSVITIHNTRTAALTHIVLHHGDQSLPLDDVPAGQTRSASVWWESEGTAFVTAKQGDEAIQHTLTEYTLAGDRLEWVLTHDTP